MYLFVFSILGLLTLILIGLYNSYRSIKDGNLEKLKFGTGFLCIVIFLLLVIFTANTFIANPEGFSKYSLKQDSLHWPSKEQSLELNDYDRILVHYFLLDADLSSNKFLSAFESIIKIDNLKHEKEIKINFQGTEHFFKFSPSTSGGEFNEGNPTIRFNTHHNQIVSRWNKHRPSTTAGSELIDWSETKDIIKSIFPERDIFSGLRNRKVFSVLSTNVAHGFRFIIYFQLVGKNSSLSEVTLEQLSRRYGHTPEKLALDTVNTGYSNGMHNQELVLGRLTKYCSVNSLFLIGLAMMIPITFRRKGTVVVLTCVLLILFMAGAEKANIELKVEVLNYNDSSLTQKIQALEFLETCLFYNDTAIDAAKEFSEKESTSAFLKAKAELIAESLSNSKYN